LPITLTLCFTDSKEWFKYRGGDERWDKKKDPSLVMGGFRYGEDSFDCVDFMALRTGKGCISLCCDGKYGSHLFFEKLFEPMGASMSNLESLSVRSDGGPYLELFGGRIKYLDIEMPVETTFPDIQKYCSNLRVLCLDEIESYYIAGTNIWEKIGDTLETINIGILYPTAEELPKIERHCRKITSLHIRKRSADPFIKLYMKCLASYGDQLQYATVYPEYKEHLEGLLEACKNARFRLDERDQIVYVALQHLGAQLEEITVGCNPMPIGNLEPLAHVWESCVNLKRATFFG